MVLKKEICISILIILVIFIAGCTSSSTQKYGYTKTTNYVPMQPKTEMSDTTLIYKTPDCDGYVEEQPIDASQQTCDSNGCSGEVISSITQCKEKCSMLVGNATRWSYLYVSSFPPVCSCIVCNVQKSQADIQKQLDRQRQYWTNLPIDENSPCSQCTDDKCLDSTTPKRCIVGDGCRIWSEPSKCVQGTCHLVENVDGRLQAQCS